MKEAILMTKNSVNPTEPKDWTILYCNTMDEVRTAVEDKAFVFPQILSGIIRMLDENRMTMMVTEIWCIEALSSIWISVTEEECEKSLQLMLDWHLSREEYEECSVVTAVIERVKARASRPGGTRSRS
jgi:hypothetical protein